jgi:1-acyl-sn-glycerol-3-phosphate acyltransferase
VNSIPNSKIQEAVEDGPAASPLRFCVGLGFTVAFWPLAVLSLMALNLVTRPFLGKKEHRMFGQRALGKSFGGFIGGLEFLGIIVVSDDDLTKHSDSPGPLIIACNHPALWDAALVLRRFVMVTCIMKEDLLENPLLCNGALFAGFIPNSPRLKMMRMALERMAEGGRLLLFPEGTRTREENGLINPFQPGVALLAMKSDAPILPVFISSDSRYLQKGWPIWRMPQLPISISIRVGESIRILPDENVRDFSRRLEGVFRSGLG